ncbi:hypothetical protein [Algoriphagus marinus]|uniref:hypothetical protein n=1 Tax=Algoriphagus marinus TaxID=1925762 RepID=UPI00094B890A|nr:hypothetical protein [Algoriphagus marinus]
MKKTRLLLKPALVLSASLVLYSCATEIESPVIQEDAKQIESINSPANGEENLRKRAERNYFERFENSLFPVPGENSTGGPDQTYYPGSGVGNSSHMGKALTFLNQFAQFGPNGLETIAAPVTMFFGEELNELGITDVPDNVSSVTTDKKGNSVWFSSISNQVTFSADGSRADFVAEVEIVGGTGKFKGATGTAEVNGFFSPSSGKGSSVIKGRITY